ncbi:hypothetical protein ABZ540_03725 [Nocardia xishanensis]
MSRTGAVVDWCVVGDECVQLAAVDSGAAVELVSVPTRAVVG